MPAQKSTDDLSPAESCDGSVVERAGWFERSGCSLADGGRGISRTMSCLAWHSVSGSYIARPANWSFEALNVSGDR